MTTRAAVSSRYAAGLAEVENRVGGDRRGQGEQETTTPNRQSSIRSKLVSYDALRVPVQVSRRSGLPYHDPKPHRCLAQPAFRWISVPEVITPFLRAFILVLVLIILLVVIGFPLGDSLIRPCSDRRKCC